MIIYIIFRNKAVGFAQPHHHVARHPHLVGRGLRALAENLKLPLALRHLGIDALDVDVRGDAQVDVLLDELAGNRPDMLVANAGVIRALRGGITVLREAQWGAILPKKVLLLESKPSLGVVGDRGARIRRMWLTARLQRFTHHEKRVLARRIGEKGDRLEQDVRALALGLLGRAAIETPKRQILQL